MIEDSPVTIGDWSPKNYGNKYKGKIPLYKALAVSSNVIAVKLIKDVGVNAVIDMARDLGITTPLTRDYTIALGSNGVKLYDMVIVYGNFANGGYKVKPYAIEKIETQRGKIIYQAGRTKISKVLDEETAGMMTTMLRQVITAGTGRGANIGKPMAGKTGTTNDNKDAWFIGYTPDIVTGVFIGNDDNVSIGLTGGTAPARIWKDMMTVATEKYGSPEFDYPSDGINTTYNQNSSEENNQNIDYESENQPDEKTSENSENQDVDKKENEPVREKTHETESFKSIPVQVSVPVETKKKSVEAE
jgi:penicillin-binding protein 1A